MSNTYSQVNQIHALSASVNAAFGFTFPTFAAMQAYVPAVINAVLTADQGAATGNNNYLGSTAAGTQWTNVWGPQVFSNNPNTDEVICDNTIGMFYNASQSLFVVAIAGTNANSMYDWGTEDFKTSTTEPWVNVSPGTKAPSTAVIATGTYVGLTNLLGIKDANGNNIIAALQNAITALGANAAAQTVAVCGHSLGGALTPPMALYLFENASTWNANNLVTSVGAYPTAGPTPGDVNFATYYESVVTANATPDPISFTYTYIYNTIDIVPQAWDLTTMITVPFLYDGSYTSQGTPPDAIIGAFTSGAICESFNTSSFLPKSNNYTHITPRTSFNGTYQKGNAVANNNPELKKIYTAINIGIPVIFGGNSTLSSSALNGNNATSTNYPDFLVDFGNFLLQAVYQHTVGYNSNTEMNIASYVAEYQQVKATISGPNVSEFQTPEGILASNLIAKHLGITNLTGLAAAAENAAANVAAN